MLGNRDVHLAILVKLIQISSHICLLFKYNSLSAPIKIPRVCGDTKLFLPFSILLLLTTVLRSGKKFSGGERARGILQQLFFCKRRKRRRMARWETDVAASPLCARTVCKAWFGKERRLICLLYRVSSPLIVPSLSAFFILSENIL